MDIYTTSFCLPRNLGPPAPSASVAGLPSHDLSPASSFDRMSANHPSVEDLSHRPGSTRPSRSNTDASSHAAGGAMAATSAATRSRVRTDSNSARRQVLEQAASKAAVASASGTSVYNGRPIGEDVTNEAVTKLCFEAMAQHQCLASVSRVGGADGTGADLVQRHQAPPLRPAPEGFDASAGPGPDFGGSGHAGPFGHPPYANAPAFNPTGPAGPAPVVPGVEVPRGKGWSFHISGGYQQVMSARGLLLRDAPFRRKSTVKVPRSEVLDAKGNVKAEMRRKLDEIAGLTRAHLVIVGGNGGGPGVGFGAMGFGLETERSVEIVISGGFEGVEQARVRLLVLLDELSGLHSEVCEIDYKLHSIIAGRKRCVVQTIQEETATSIYFPTPLSGVLGQRQPGLIAKQNLIFITGEFFGAQRARDMLFQVSMHKSKCIISRDSAILPRKLDWMLTDRLDELRTFMHDNATFINFPVIGSQTSLISVYGDHRVNIERTLRSVMQLACQFYVASFWLLPTSFDVFMPPAAMNTALVPPILKHISAITGAEVVFKSNCFEMHGIESEVRQAVGMVMELEIVRGFHHEIRFQIELANEHREFISGKKNGKLNKIMKAANVKIKFETFNDWNFLIDVAGGDDGALAGLTLLQEELPAEISFHIPEGYHKRIIGVGGKNIQRIMKKYGVYVKFSNAEDHAQLGGYVDNEDNVVARTPGKNAINLENLKQSVMEMVHPKDKDFVHETVPIPRRYQRTLLGEKSIFIHDIEAKTNSIIRFPPKESASDIVTVFGPESQVHIAAQMLLVHIPHEAEYRLPHSVDMAALTLSGDWQNLVERVKRDLNVVVLPFVDRSGGHEETVLKFCLTRANMDFLAHARDVVEEFLLSRRINLYPHAVRPRADSFADSFPYFNSKLLSAGSEVDLRADFNKVRAADLRPAASTPDIKALFDAPGPSSSVLGHRGSMAVGADAMKQGGPPLSLPADYGRWGAPRQVQTPYSPQPSYSSQPNYSPSYQHAHSRLSAEESALTKRASDHQLEEKMRRSTPRSFIPRAQSLDMGRLDGSLPPAPASATLLRPRYNEHAGADEVTRVLSNLGL